MSLTPRIDKNQKNYIINGDMRISQRNTTFAAAAGYTLDRWLYAKSGAMVHTVTQDTDVPSLAQSGYLFQNSLRANLTTPENSVATGGYCMISQKIEGFNWANIAQKPFTVSFWVKATVTGIYSVSCQNIGSGTADRSATAEYTINAANTWEKKTISFLASPAGGTWNYGNGVGMILNFVIAAGSSLRASSGTWQTGNFVAGMNQINGTATGSTDFKITGVCVYEGTIADPDFSTFGKSFDLELAACQRYYEKSYQLGTNPGANTTINLHYNMLGGPVLNNFGFGMTVQYKVTKRTTPAIVVYDANGIAARVDLNGVSVSCLSANEGQNSFSPSNSSGTSQGAAGNFVRFHWTSDSEL